MSKNWTELTLENKKEIAEIIISGKKVHDKTREYLKNHGFIHTGKNKIKDLIKLIINELNLNKDKCLSRYANINALNQSEFDVIVGGLLGDTWLGFMKNSAHASGSFTHKLEHLEYVQYKQSLLKSRCSEVKIHNKFDSRSNRHYQQAFCKIAASPILDEIQQKFYQNKIKIVPKDLIDKLSPLGIAIWFMDDGTSTTAGLSFAVNCFTKEDIEILKDMLYNKFGIESTIQINQNKTLYIKHSSQQDFIKLIKPYVCDCMKYKLRTYHMVNGKYIIKE